jgi:tetratricopeptide (TPR) repeat protein
VAEPGSPETFRCEHCGAVSARVPVPPRRRRRWLRRAAWLALPAVALVWTFSPGYVAISLVGDLPALAPIPDHPATPEDRAQCRSGLERLDRAQAMARFWPPLRREFEGYRLAYQRAALLECAGDVAGARGELRAEIERLEANLPAAPIDWTHLSADQQRAVQVPSYWSALAAVEERAGDPAAALAAYQNEVAVSSELDGGASWGTFTADAASEMLDYLVRSGDEARARDFYRTTLGAAEAAGASEEELVPLLEPYAELLEARGHKKEAAEIYARIGRLDSESSEDLED